LKVRNFQLIHNRAQPIEEEQVKTRKSEAEEIESIESYSQSIQHPEENGS